MLYRCYIVYAGSWIISHCRQTDSSEKILEASRTRVRHNCRPSAIPLDFTMGNHNSCRPVTSRGQKPKVSSVALIHKAPSEFDEFPMISQASSLSVKPPGESAQGFIPDSRLRPQREDIFSGRRKKKESERETERKRVIYRVAQTLRNFSPTSIEHLAQKVAHYRRGTSRTGSRYNMNSRVINGGISYIPGSFSITR